MAKNDSTDNKPVQQAAQQNALALVKRDVVDVVQSRVESMIEKGELSMPPGFAVGNAVTSWWLKLQATKDRDKRPALEVCTRDSIANATLDMLVQGLNAAKSQCYPIVFGDQLVCMRGFIGSIAVVKYIYGQGTRVWSEAVYEGDELEYTIARGRKIVTKHTQTMENVNTGKIVAAYAIVEPEKEGVEPACEIMTMAKIERAWQQGQTKGNSPAHQGFPDEMARKTVINRACKLLISTADDSHLVAHHAKRQDQVIAEAEMTAEIEENANGELLTLEGDYRQPTQPGQSGPLESAYEDQDPGGPGSPPADEPPVTANPKGGQARLEPDF